MNKHTINAVIRNSATKEIVLMVEVASADDSLVPMVAEKLYDQLTEGAQKNYQEFFKSVFYRALYDVKDVDIALFTLFQSNHTLIGANEPLELLSKVPGRIDVPSVESPYEVSYFITSQVHTTLSLIDRLPDAIVFDRNIWQAPIQITTGENEEAKQHAEELAAGLLEKFNFNYPIKEETFSQIEETFYEENKTSDVEARACTTTDKCLTALRVIGSLTGECTQPTADAANDPSVES